MTLRTSDSFTDGQGVVLTSHVGEIGATWQKAAGFDGASAPLFTAANRIRGQGSGGVICVASGVAAVDGEVAEASIQTLTNAPEFGILARAKASSGGQVKGYMAWYSNSSGDWKIIRWLSNATVLQFGSTVNSPLSAAAHTVRLTVTGTGASVAIALVVDGVALINTTDTSASRITSLGSVGVYFAVTQSDTAGTHIDSITYNDGAGSSTVTGVTVSPSTATVVGGATQAFSAVVAGTGSPSQSVNWTASAGIINSGGTFTAPAATGSAQTITITATSVQDGAFSGTATVTVPAATLFDVTSPADGRIYPLSGGATGTAAFTFGGTYSGSAPNEWRLVEDGTNTPISGFDWTAFSAAPAAGTFSQNVTAVPKTAGWYNVQVRNSAAPGFVEAGGKVGAGVLVHVDGQSNAWLWFSPTAYAGDSTLAPSPLLRVTGKQASTPNVAWDVPAAVSMNASIACGNALVAALSCPVALIDGSWDGSGLVVPSNGGQWISGGAAGNAYTSSAAALTAAGGSAAATVFIQGESDSGSGVTQAAYYAGLGQMIALRRTAVANAAHPYVLVPLARDLTGTRTDAQREAIKAAQVQKCADADVYRVDRMDLPLHTDNVHHTAAGFKTLGERVARAVLAALGVVSTYRGPRIAAVAQTVTPAVFDVTLTHSMGTDFTPTSGITGFRATVAGSPVTISSASRQAADVVRLTLAATPASMPVVQYLYGTAPTVTGVVKDNGALTLPLEYSPGVTATEYVAEPVGADVVGSATMAWAAVGSVSATLGPAPMSGSVAGIATMAWSATGSVSVDLIDLPPDTITAAVAGVAAMAWAATGGIVATVLPPPVEAAVQGLATMAWAATGSVQVSDGSIIWPTARAGEANTARVPFDGVRIIVPDADDPAAPVKAVPLYVADTERLLVDWEAKYLPGAGDTAATVLALDAPAGLVVTPSVAPGAALTTGVVVLAVTPTGAAGTYRVALRISTAGGRESTALVDVVVSSTLQPAKTFRLRSTADRDVFDLDFAAKYLAGTADAAANLLTTSADAGLTADARLDAGGVVQVAVEAATGGPSAPGTYHVRTQLQTAAGRRKTGAIAVEVLA